MERTYDSTGQNLHRVMIHRSTNSAVSWVPVDTIPGEGNFYDPVLCTDDDGSVYLVVMHGITFTQWDLLVYRSDDDGLSWKLVGTPHINDDLADYPQIISAPDDHLFLVYTHFDLVDKKYEGKIIFMRSIDKGAGFGLLVTC